MVNDGLFGRFGTPDVVIGQHVAPLPAGAIGMRVGPAFAASDALRVTLYGRGEAQAAGADAPKRGDHASWMRSMSGHGYPCWTSADSHTRPNR